MRPTGMQSGVMALAVAAGAMSAAAAPPGSWTDGLGDWQDPTSPLGQAIDEAGKRAVLADVLAAMAQRAGAPGVLPPAREILQDPLHADRIALEYAALLDGLEDNPFGVVAQAAAQVLGVELVDPSGQGELDVMHIRAGINAMNFLTNGSDYLVREALGAQYGDAALAMMLRDAAFNRGPDDARDDRPDEAAAFFADLDLAGLLNAFEHYHVGVALNADFASGRLYEEPPAELAAAFEGEIVDFDRIREVGWVVVGGVGDNRYDMGVIAAVLDPDGNDEYWMSKPRIGNSLIIDAAGNDRYVGGETQGPGAGVLGVAIIDDRAGDDEYTAQRLAFGAGLAGIGMVIDRGGRDRYACAYGGLGYAVAGVGVLVDLGDDDDRYVSVEGAQGAGGSRGWGCLIDAGGDDRYQGAVIDATLQGVGFPWRSGGLTAGVGMLIDRAGDDLYATGSGQAAAVAGGLGLLLDVAGDDWYQVTGGAGQGVGVDAGVGIAIDLAGNDVRQGTGRFAMSADAGLAVVRDDAGDDVLAWSWATGLRADDSIAAFIDGNGADRHLGDASGAAGPASVSFLRLMEPPPWSAGVFVPRSPKPDAETADK